MGADGLMQYTHLLIEARSKYSLSLRPFSFTHTTMDFVEGFWHVSFNYHNFPPMEIKTRPQVFILKRNDDYKSFFSAERKTSNAENSDKEEQFSESIPTEQLLTEEVQNQDANPDSENCEILTEGPKKEAEKAEEPQTEKPAKNRDKTKKKQPSKEESASVPPEGDQTEIKNADEL